MALAANAERLEVRMRDLILQGAIEPEETVRYVARPGLRALPAEIGGALAVAGAPVLPFTFFLWEIRRPWPTRTGGGHLRLTRAEGRGGLGGSLRWARPRGN